MIHTFPILYKNNYFWKIWVLNNEIHVSYGKIGGKTTHPEPKIIDKSIGKKTPHERAVQLAKTKWKNKIISDKYSNVQNSDTPQFKPMNPSNFDEKNLNFPLYLQPKLDGNRAIFINGEFISRQGKPFKYLDFLKKDLNTDLILDGELLSKDISLKDMRSIFGKKDEKDIDKKKLKTIKYYIFDCYDKTNPTLPYNQRLKLIEKIQSPNVILTPTILIKDNRELNKEILRFKKEGKEGGIIRIPNGIYKMRSTSKDVMKIKFYNEDNFRIVNYYEGKGNDKGTVIWEVKCLNSPETFKVKPMGTREYRQKLYKEGEQYINKELTVQYYEIDKKGCVKRIKTGFFK